MVGHVVPLEEGRPSGPAAEGERRPVPVRTTTVPRQREAREETPELVVDRACRVVRVDGEEIDLTFREFELLDYLSAAPGRVHSRRQLLAAVWDRYGDEGGRTVDVHVLRLRRKLGRFADRIVTVRNVGYKYQPPRRP
ncbi:winged helix-turn-helix transcriptional regulator [Microbispora sp. RL4-1S]|uniref:Winged helix-turn-helix transcriptional regulator n=2 Tax=Microbispora oryzae TaxID=2806554 RepID=A0A940WP61_9ACTN|nr:winged helix-turn-helix transcriptional regulator [Microbispora oryzae]